MFMSRRFALSLAVLVAVGCAQAASAQKVELTPHIGYRFGGTISDLYTAAQYDINASESYGLTLNYTIGLMGDTQLDFSWSRQDTDFEVFNFNRVETYDVTIDYWQAGGLKQWHEDESVRPFVLASIGAAHYSPGPADWESATRFAFGLGGGVKLFPGQHIGFRLQGRLLGTYASGGGAIFCSGGCAFAFGGNFLWQMEFTAGLVFAFGD
jgi:hypothetical protein